MRKTFIIVTALGIQYLVLEVILRLVLFGFSEDALSPYNTLLTRHYPELTSIFLQEEKKEKKVKKILILGGSVVSTNWSHLEKRLSIMLGPHFPKGTEIRVMNAAAPANTSLDNLIKYRALSDYYFDLILYYEAINETRFNNIPDELFKADYSHVSWYRRVQLILQHPELNFSVIPYTLHFIYFKLKNHFTNSESLSLEGVPPSYVTYGNKIKTAIPYRKNIQELIDMTQSRDQRLLLMSYASFFPDGVHLQGGKVDNNHFGKCSHHSSIDIWGDADNVQKGIRVHNWQLRELVALNRVDFLDMASLMPPRKNYFCDVCHLSQEAGAQYFATLVKNHILANGLLVPR